MSPARTKPILRLVAPPPAAPFGGEVELGALYRRYAPYVARVALRLLGRGHEVEDVVQDVFVMALRGIEGVRDPEAIRGWLAAVTTRVASRRIKRQRWRRWLRLDAVPHYVDLEAPGASAEDRALLVWIYDVLDRQPLASRNAWILRHIEGERLESIAVMTGCSLATVKRRIALAQLAVEEALGDD